MKVVFWCCVLLLAGSASCSFVEANSMTMSDFDIPEWIWDLLKTVEPLDAFQKSIDRMPEIVAVMPDIINRNGDIIRQIINEIPEAIPIILDKLHEIITQIPTLVPKIHEILEIIIYRLPELIPIILEKNPYITTSIPTDQIKKIHNRIREFLEESDLPDWFPTLLELEKPESWSSEIPELFEYNIPTPGTPTSVSKYPGIVQIEVGTGLIWAQGCAGSILTSFFILSSARCFSGRNFNNRFRRVRAGSSTRHNGGVIVAVQYSTNHPNFDSNNFNGDISVVKLQTNLIFSANIQQTPILPQDFNLPIGIDVHLAGWGSTAEGKFLSNRGLYSIILTTVDKETCVSRWRQMPLFTVTNNTICVADPKYGGRNGDVRDMGVPIYYQGILVGIESFGASVGNQHFPVVATFIASYTNWIVDTAR